MIDLVNCMEDTIVGIATGMAGGGIGVIRLSGKLSVEIADKVFYSSKLKNLEDAQSHYLYYGFIKENENIIDEVMCVVMRAPKTYTREDVVEIQCHGGVYVIKKIVDLLVKNGARISEPGEFTKRAFLNGRIDLSQAEAVMDVISAKNEYALKNSISQLRGEIKEKIEVIREEILRDMSFIEAALDDPEHYDVDGYGSELKDKVLLQLEHLNRILERSEDGRKLTEGIKTAIIGKPNAGKSSLLNMLVGNERAIVTDIAGTTRDSLEETVQIGNITLLLTDTAGIRDTEDVVEKIGVERAKKYIDESELILYVVDTSVPLSEEDEEIISMIENKQSIVLMNKSDLKPVITENDLQISAKKISISASLKEGKEELEKEIENLFFNGKIHFDNEVYITNGRHKQAIGNAVVSLKKVLDSIENEMPEDFYSIDLMDAYTVLGTILGETVEDDLVDKIFKEFCMGK